MLVAGRAILVVFIILSLWGCCVPMHIFHDDHDNGHEHSQTTDHPASHEEHEE